MSHILLVEDSEECQISVRRALQNGAVTLTALNTRDEARSFMKKNNRQIDLAILDLSLPDGDGFQVLEDLREAGMPELTPVFFLTSKSDLEAKVMAFQLGADDYLVKPVSPVELRMRVESRLKKSNGLLSETITRGELLIEIKHLRASRLGKDGPVDLSLTAKEFKILSFLVRHENQLFTRTELVSSVWGKNVNVLDRTVDSHIYGLRKKMGSLASYIECVPNAGYQFSYNSPQKKATSTF